MHCRACDKMLSDYESTRKDATTGEYIDMCNKCFSFVKDVYITIDRPDLEESVAEEDTSILDNETSSD